MRQSPEGDSLMATEHSLLQWYVMEEQELGSPASEGIDHGCDITKWVQDWAGSAVFDVFANLRACFIGSS